MSLTRFHAPTEYRRYDTIGYDTIRYDTIRYDTNQCYIILYNTTQYDTLQCNCLFRAPHEESRLICGEMNEYTENCLISRFEGDETNRVLILTISILSSCIICPKGGQHQAPLIRTLAHLNSQAVARALAPLNNRVTNTKHRTK